jgi:hypothetical protein
VDSPGCVSCNPRLRWWGAAEERRDRWDVFLFQDSKQDIKNGPVKCACPSLNLPSNFCSSEIVSNLEIVFAALFPHPRVCCSPTQCLL